MASYSFRASFNLPYTGYYSWFCLQAICVRVEISAQFETSSTATEIRMSSICYGCEGHELAANVVVIVEYWIKPLELASLRWLLFSSCPQTKREGINL